MNPLFASRAPAAVPHKGAATSEVGKVRHWNDIVLLNRSVIHIFS